MSVPSVNDSEIVRLTDYGVPDETVGEPDGELWQKALATAENERRR